MRRWSFCFLYPKNILETYLAFNQLVFISSYNTDFNNADYDKTIYTITSCYSIIVTDKLLWPGWAGMRPAIF
jgi:hypothetical protein